MIEGETITLLDVLRPAFGSSPDPTAALVRLMIFLLVGLLGLGLVGRTRRSGLWVLPGFAFVLAGTGTLSFVYFVLTTTFLPEMIGPPIDWGIGPWFPNLYSVGLLVLAIGLLVGFVGEWRTRPRPSSPRKSLGLVLLYAAALAATLQASWLPHAIGRLVFEL